MSWSLNFDSVTRTFDSLNDLFWPDVLRPLDLVPLTDCLQIPEYNFTCETQRKTKHVMLGQHYSMDTIDIRKDIEEYREQ